MDRRVWEDRHLTAGKADRASVIHCPGHSECRGAGPDLSLMYLNAIAARAVPVDQRPQQRRRLLLCRREIGLELAVHHSRSVARCIGEVSRNGDRQGHAADRHRERFRRKPDVCRQRTCWGAGNGA